MLNQLPNFMLPVYREAQTIVTQRLKKELKAIEHIRSESKYALDYNLSTSCLVHPTRASREQDAEIPKRKKIATPKTLARFLSLLTDNERKNLLSFCHKQTKIFIDFSSFCLNDKKLPVTVKAKLCDFLLELPVEQHLHFLHWVHTKRNDVWQVFIRLLNKQLSTSVQNSSNLERALTTDKNSSSAELDEEEL